MGSLVLVAGVSTFCRDLRVAPTYPCLFWAPGGGEMQPYWDPWPHTRVFQYWEICRMSGGIAKYYIWTKSLLGVGETGFQAPRGLSYMGVKRYSFTLYMNTGAQEAFRTSWGFQMAQLDQ